MSTPDPYATIEKVPLYASDNMQSQGYSVRLEDPSAEDGWKEVGIVSRDYLLVPNRQVRDMAYEITGRTNLQWSKEKVFFDGKRFAFVLTTRECIAQEVTPGDPVGLGLMFENSYDGSRKLAASLLAYRLACSNGMLTPEHFARMRFKHDRSSKGWEKDARRAMSMLGSAEEGLKRFVRGARTLQELTLTPAELKDLRQHELKDLPVTLWGKTVDQFLLDEEHTGWGLLNAGTHATWHRDRSIRDFTYNEQITEGLLQYAQNLSSNGSTNGDSHRLPPAS